MNELVYIKKLDEKAILPVYKTNGSSAMDIFSLYDYEISNLDGVCLIRTGIAVSIPEGLEIQIRQRSGMSSKYPNYLANCIGTIDSDYRDEIFIPIINNTDKKLIIKYGQRIAQLKLAYTLKIKWCVVKEFLDKNINRNGGFGSTGEF